MVIVVMGVAGSGKTRVGRALAEDLRWPFFDADDFHPEANIARMAGGRPLTDADREPWLAELHALVLRTADAVLACSALKSRFRDQLRSGVDDLHYVYLQAKAELIRPRLAAREDHFMPPELLQSQFEALEEPEDALVLDASKHPDVLIAQIRTSLRV